MATIVLVHGIAQEQRGAAVLEQQWLPALADGLRAAGHPHLADRMWRAGQSDIDVRMAFYGDLFLTPGTMGPDTALPDQQLAAQLAEEWLHRAADPNRQHPDRADATVELAHLHPDGRGRQGLRADIRRAALISAARLRWFAPLGMAFAERFVSTALRQVTTYLSDDAIRQQVQQRVAAHIGADTVAIIGHSLGSVVAYETAHTLTAPLPLLLTLGSPLGLRTIVYDRVRPQPSFPTHVHHWVNIADRNDLVAAVPDLTPDFTRYMPADARFDGNWTVDNGAKPHQAEFYLTKPQTGQPLATSLTP